jgi:endonuclease YncB( thermonuclease family)
MLEFDLASPAEVPVRVGSERFVLMEAMGDAVRKWRNAVLKCTQIGEDGKPRAMHGLADTESLLVSLCLCSADEDGNVRRNSRGDTVHVPVERILAWPNRVQAELFQVAKRISGIDAPDTAESLREQIAQLQERLEAVEKNGS